MQHWPFGRGFLMGKVEDEADYTKLRQHYFESYIESDAPCLHGTSGALLRHKRKRLPRIESDSAGYKVLRQKVKQLKKTGSHGEIYNLLRQLWTFEQSLVARGLPLPFALRESGTQKDIAEVVDITDDNEIIDVD